MDRRRLLGVALAAASACGYGSGALFAKSVYGAGIDWLALLFWRFLIGGALVWAWTLLFRDNRAALRALSLRRTLALLGLGAFFVMNASTYYAALQYVSASLAALIVYIYPALVAVLSIRWGHGLHGRRPWAALVLVTFGVVLTIGGIETRADPVGLVLIVASPIIYSVYIMLAAHLAGERRGETAASRTGGAGAETRPAVAASLMITGTFAVVAVLAVAAGEPVLPGQVPAGAWFGLLGIAAFSTALSISAFYAATARIGAAQTALISTVEPVWTITLATLFFDERLGPIQLLGGALVIGGVILAQTTPGATLDVVVEEA
ncbi:MAG: DMT family transporter [Chloroflexota bacterium]